MFNLPGFPESGFALRSASASLLLLGAGWLAGCAGTASVQTLAPRSGFENYVYYPNYEVYYARNRRQYVYRNGEAWMTSRKPVGVGAGELLGSPSVRLEFHDPPAAHHAEVTRMYPRNWTPPSRPAGPAENPMGGRVTPHGLPWPSQTEFGIEE